MRAAEQAEETVNLALARSTPSPSVACSNVMTASVGGSNDNNLNVPPVVEFEPSSEHRPISDAKLLANRLNAKLSSGAKTEAGHQASSMNALSHGLTAKAACLLGDDVDAYQQLVASHFSRYSPATDEENELVQLIADAQWRILKVAPQEAAIYEVGRLEHPGLYFNEVEDITRCAIMVEAKIGMLYEKHFRNLHLQERRWRNQHTSDMARLKGLQQERMEKSKREAKEATEENERQVTRAANIWDRCKLHKMPFQPADFGFDFSLAEWEHYKSLQGIHYILSREFLDLQKVVATYRASQEEPKVA